MNRWLQYFNFFGVMALAGLCVFQWQTNRRMNLEVNRLQKIGISQTAQFEEQSKKLKGTTADLETFREQLTRAHLNLNEQTERSASAESKLNAITLERDALKSGLSQWTNAVAERDQSLKESNAQIKKLADDLKAAVLKYNQLASNYNAVVKDLNAERSPPVSTNR